MANTFLSKTLSGSPTDSNKWTWSAWVKRSKLTSEQVLFYADDGGTNYYGRIQWHDTDSLSFRNKYASTNSGYAVTTAKFRDTSAWYHLVCVLDTSNSTAGDRMIIYVNGERITAFDTFNAIDQNAGTTINDGYQHRIGKGNATSGTSFFDGQMSHVHFIDGQAYGPTVFGETDATTGEWKIKTDVTATYGTNGFFILKDGNSVTDQSGNSNTFLNAGGTLTKTEDSPSNVFPTINALNYQLSGCALSNGNTSLASTGGNGWRTMHGTLAGSTGKFYWEQKINGYAGSSHYIGITDIDEASNNNSNDFELGGVSSYCYRADGGKVTSVSGSTVLTAGVGASFTTNDIIGIAMDLDNQKIYFSKNGTWQNSGDPTSGATGTGSFFNITAGKLYTPATATYDTSQLFSYNFGNGFFATTAVASAGTNASGNGIFEYDTPNGYTALSTKGLNL